jgi:hypothetical protein
MRAFIAILCALPGSASVVSAQAAKEHQDTIAPFLKNHCVSCHGGVNAKGQLLLGRLTGNLVTDRAEALLWTRVLARLEADEMPPADMPRPRAADRSAVLAWIRGELKKAAATPLLSISPFPGDGNRLPHELLFGKDAKAGLSASPPRLWRNRLAIYEDHFTYWLNPKRKPLDPEAQAFRPELAITLHEYSPPWGDRTAPGFKDYSALTRVDQNEMEILIANAAEVAHRWLQRPERKTKDRSAILALLDAGDDAGETQIQAGLREAFALALRRTPMEAELKRYGDFLRKNYKTLGPAKGLETTLTAVLLHPETMYRFELGGGAADQHGRTMLAPLDLAKAIAYALTDRAPDADLVRAAEAGRLQSAEDVRREVARLLADPKIPRERILPFFREYFGYPAAIELFKDPSVLKSAGIGGYWPETLVNDTDFLILTVLQKDRHVLKELLTTRAGFVHSLRGGPPGKGKPPVPKPYSSYHYNYQSDTWTPLGLVEFPAEERAGILTQPSWLIAFSTNFENHAIERGKWVREKLLGGSLPDVPITVEAQLPEDPHRTLRDRMKVTRQAFCWQCHHQMDPLGLTFEMFDGLGRYRTQELGKPVDTSGEIIASGDPKLDGKVTNALELLRKLAESEHVQQVFVRHAFRFWMGRNETLSDAPTLQAAYRAYRDSDGSMRALITSLLTSDAFLYRR